MMMVMIIIIQLIELVLEYTYFLKNLIKITDDAEVSTSDFIVLGN